ncbi:hypothetical protein JFU37_19390 [Pseudomonas sp. TH41]|uniref:hypothetical protein n=1 Tax=Pseudomonas sp. TH41 TaxID=2796405 RepID=UPI001914C5E2|nr:hypothetical protein [Pseudomonas sp. TH41]MBK5354646.1 hypothetical protein [Pseudomonas sp. TH41]
MDQAENQYVVLSSPLRVNGLDVTTSHATRAETGDTGFGQRQQLSSNAIRSSWRSLRSAA